MAYLQLQSTADYVMHKSFTVETTDYMDHTFCGVMFDVSAKSTLPVEYLEISAIWVRGALGNLTVWYTKGGHKNKYSVKSAWTKVFEGNKPSSMSSLVCLELDTKLRLKPGELIGLYVHSTRQDDQAIVYDNQRHDVSHEDRYLQVLPGSAHVSPIPFNLRGWWGWAWRPNREFVGRLSHGVRFLMWQADPDVHIRFPRKFRRAAETLTMCSYRHDCPLNWMPVEVTFYILNLCSWDWFGDLEKDEDTTVSTKETMATEDDEGGIGWQDGIYSHLIHRQARSYLRHLESEYDEEGFREVVSTIAEHNRGLAEHFADDGSDSGDDDGAERAEGEDDDGSDEEVEIVEMSDSSDDDNVSDYEYALARVMAARRQRDGAVADESDDEDDEDYQDEAAQDVDDDDSSSDDEHEHTHGHNAHASKQKSKGDDATTRTGQSASSARAAVVAANDDDDDNLSESSDTAQAEMDTNADGACGSAK